MLTYDQFVAALQKLNQFRPDLPVIVYDADTTERMGVLAVRKDAQGQVVIYIARN